MIEMATQKPPWGAHDISNHLALIFKVIELKYSRICIQFNVEITVTKCHLD